MTRRKLVVGNWKMNGSRAANAELLAGLKAAGPWVGGRGSATIRGLIVGLGGLTGGGLGGR